MAELIKKENNTVEFRFSVDAKTFEEGMAKAFKKMSGQFQIPGFRKGKAPRKIIESMYTEAVFYDEAINLVCPQAYDDAVKELELEPVDRPEIDVEEVGTGKDLVMTAKVTVKPEVTLGKYKGISIEKAAYTVEDEDVEKRIELMRERNARILTVEDRAIESGDIAVIDYEGKKDGVAFAGGTANGYELTIGSGTFIPGFEDQLIGKKAGEKVEVNVTFPEDYHAEELKGAPVVFDVTINEIKKKELPEVDDEFAKDVSEFETVEELRADIRKKMEEDAAARTKDENEQKAVEAAVDAATVDLPPVMIDQQLEMTVRDYEMRMQQQGLTLDQYLKITGGTLESFKEQFREQAEKQVKTSLVLEAVAKAEALEATDEEIEEKYKELAEAYKMDVEMIKAYIPADDLRHDVLVRKAVELIAAESKAKAKRKGGKQE